MQGMDRTSKQQSMQGTDRTSRQQSMQGMDRTSRQQSMQGTDRTSLQRKCSHKFRSGIILFMLKWCDSLDPLPQLYRIIIHTMAALNFLSIITGFLFMTLGSVIVSASELHDRVSISTTTFDHGTLQTGASIIIAGGILIMLNSLFGCYSAVRISFVYMAIHCVLLSILFLMVLTGTSMVTSFRSNYQDDELLSDELKKNMEKHNTNITKNNPTNRIDTMQITMICCGVMGVSDWKGRLPESCCRQGRDAVYINSIQCRHTHDITTEYLRNTHGCKEKLKIYVYEYFSMYIKLLFGMTFWMLFVNGVSGVGTFGVHKHLGNNRI